MPGSRQSGLDENAKLIRMNEELGVKMHELGRKMNAQLNEIKGRIAGEAVKPGEYDRARSAGC